MGTESISITVISYEVLVNFARQMNGRQCRLAESRAAGHRHGDTVTIYGHPTPLIYSQTERSEFHLGWLRLPLEELSDKCLMPISVRLAQSLPMPPCRIVFADMELPWPNLEAGTKYRVSDTDLGISMLLNIWADSMVHLSISVLYGKIPSHAPEWPATKDFLNVA